MESVVNNIESRTPKRTENPLEDLGALRWIRALSYRVPGANVILVGTKCDLVDDSPEKTAEARLTGAAGEVEQEIREWIHKWTTQSSQNQSPSICLEEGASLVSCVLSRGSKDGGWPCDVSQRSLLHRIKNDDVRCKRRGVDMLLPLSWQYALDLLDDIARDTRRVFLGCPYMKRYIPCRETPCTFCLHLSEASRDLP